jgi:hypothetical protein
MYQVMFQFSVPGLMEINVLVRVGAAASHAQAVYEAKIMLLQTLDKEKTVSLSAPTTDCDAAKTDVSLCFDMPPSQIDPKRIQCRKQIDGKWADNWVVMASELKIVDVTTPSQSLFGDGEIHQVDVAAEAKHFDGICCYGMAVAGNQHDEDCDQAKLEKKALDLSIGDVDLDDEVLDVFSEQSSAINNDGIQAQLAFLRGHLGYQATSDILDGIGKDTDDEEDDTKVVGD